MANPNNWFYDAHGVYTNAPGGIKPSTITEVPMIGPDCASLNGTVTVTNTSGTVYGATISWPKIQKKCKIMGVRTIGQETLSNARVVIKNDADTVATVAMVTSGAVVNATSIVAAYSTLNPGDVLSATVERTSGGAVSTISCSVLIDLAPIGNN